MIDRIALVTDFGIGGPYVGQIRLRLSESIPLVPVISLMLDLAPFRPDLAAYLLPALVQGMPEATLYVCVVDPGVGGERAALAVMADGGWYVGPDNGLLTLVARRAREVQILRLNWWPSELSPSFHGRDLFAPVAAMLCKGEIPPHTRISSSEMVGADWENELSCVTYADQYGNLMTGLRGASIDRGAILCAGGRDLTFARTFCDVPRGEAFWYVNSLGLVELAVNQGHASTALMLEPGDPISVRPCDFC